MLETSTTFRSNQELEDGFSVQGASGCQPFVREGTGLGESILRAERSMERVYRSLPTFETPVNSNRVPPTELSVAVTSQP